MKSILFKLTLPLAQPKLNIKGQGHLIDWLIDWLIDCFVLLVFVAIDSSRSSSANICTRTTRSGWLWTGPVTLTSGTWTTSGSAFWWRRAIYSLCLRERTTASPRTRSMTCMPCACLSVIPFGRQSIVRLTTISVDWTIWSFCKISSQRQLLSKTLVKNWKKDNSQKRETLKLSVNSYQ